MSARLRDVFVFDLQPAVAAMPVSVDQPVESEIQLCRTGAFYRSDQGHFKVTPRTLEKMLANAVERGVDIPINYFHKGNDPSAPRDDRDAAGWVSPKSLSIRGYKGGYALFGRARWTADAVGKLKDQKVRYISPEIDWVATRLAASEAGPAGQPIGPMLTGAALVNDPFFTMNPVTLSRRAPQRGKTLGASKRYSMFDKKTTDAMSAVLKDNGMPEANIPAALLALIQLDEAADAAQDAPPPEVIAEATPPVPPTTEGAAAASLAASRESAKVLAARVKQLEDAEAARTTEQGQALFTRYAAEGRFRVYAIAGSDPTGEKKAKEHLAKGVAFFREVFDAVPPLVGTRAPVTAERLTTSGGLSGSSMIGADQGLGLHNRVLGELKTKNLNLTSKEGKAEYARLTAHYSR